MSILAIMFVKLFNYECSGSLSKRVFLFRFSFFFFAGFAASNNCESKNASFFNLNDIQTFFRCRLLSALQHSINLGIVEIGFALLYWKITKTSSF